MGCVGLLLSLCAFEACSSPVAPVSQSTGSAGGPTFELPPPDHCPDAGPNMPQPSACVPLRHRDFTTEIVPLFSGCGGETCHSFAAGAIASQIGTLASECCNQIAVIEPGRPEKSYLLSKLAGTDLCAGDRMPLGRSAFNNDDLQAVSDWICEGAPSSP